VIFMLTSKDQEFVDTIHKLSDTQLEELLRLAENILKDKNMCFEVEQEEK